MPFAFENNFRAGGVGVFGHIRQAFLNNAEERGFYGWRTSTLDGGSDGYGYSSLFEDPFREMIDGRHKAQIVENGRS